MGSEYPELHEQRDIVRKWLESEEESFGRTLEQGTKLLDELIARARTRGRRASPPQDAFLLHDTYGFPIDLTLEIVAEHELGVDEEGFEALMDEQRDRARASAGRDARPRGAARAGRGVRRRGRLRRPTSSATRRPIARRRSAPSTTDDGRVLVKLVESPFYATGGGQVADSGYVECADGDCPRVVGRAAPRRRPGRRRHARYHFRRIGILQRHAIPGEA